LVYPSLNVFSGIYTSCSANSVENVDGVLYGIPARYSPLVASDTLSLPGRLETDFLAVLEYFNPETRLKYSLL
jgi:hypothetical protein